jgi:hypothetical protein
MDTARFSLVQRSSSSKTLTESSETSQNSLKVSGSTYLDLNATEALGCLTGASVFSGGVDDSNHNQNETSGEVEEKQTTPAEQGSPSFLKRMTAIFFGASGFIGRIYTPNQVFPAPQGARKVEPPANTQAKLSTPRTAPPVSPLSERLQVNNREPISQTEILCGIAARLAGVQLLSIWQINDRTLVLFTCDRVRNSTLALDLQLFDRANIARKVKESSAAFEVDCA